MSTKDLDFSLRKKSNNDILVKTDEEAFIQKLEYVLLTEPGEKLFDSSGSRIFSFLSSPVNMLDASSIQNLIFEKINNYMPEIKISLNSIKINVDTIEQVYELTITYQDINNELQTIEFVLEKFR